MSLVYLKAGYVRPWQTFFTRDVPRIQGEGHPDAIIRGTVCMHCLTIGETKLFIHDFAFYEPLGMFYKIFAASISANTKLRGAIICVIRLLGPP